MLLGVGVCGWGGGPTTSGRSFFSSRGMGFFGLCPSGTDDLEFYLS